MATDLDERQNVAENLLKDETDFSEQINDKYRHAGGSSDVVDDMDEHGAGIGGFLKNYNADDPDLQNQEKNQNPVLGSTKDGKKTREGFGARFRNGFKKNGASGGIIGLLVGGFVSSSFFLVPGSILATIEKAMTNDASDATRTNIVMRRAYIGGLFSKTNCKTAACEKLTKMSDTQKANWEKQGFKVTLDAERNVTEIKFPDGERVRNAAEYDAKVKSSLSGRLSADKVVNIRSAFFQNAKFDKVLEKLGIKKSTQVKASEDPDKAKRTEEMAKSIDENSKASTGDTNEARAAKIRSQTTESSSFRDKISKIANDPKTKAGQILNAATSAACAAYNIARITTATVKAKYIFDLVNFAFPFVQAASQIYYYGSIKPELVEYLADRLTWYDKNETFANGTKNPKYGLTAMDSQGLQMAIYGDFTKLQAFTQQYTTGILGAAITGSNAIRSIQNTIGKDNIHNICVVNSYIGMASTVFCASPMGAVACVAGAAGIILFGPELAKKAVQELGEPAIKIIADANLTSSLKGVDAGNALAAGIGLMLMNSSMGYGLMMAASAADVNQFISMTNDDYYQYGEELARYEAKSQPFDTTNQYSFIGQLASAFNPYRSGDGTIFSQVLNGFAVVSSPLGKLSGTANALYSQPSNMTLEKSSDPSKDSATNRLAKMPDPDMQAIGAVNDWSGKFVGITPPGVLAKMAGQAVGSNTAIADTVDYMSTNGYINDDGSVKSGSEYDKYINYWDDRKDPPGTTSETILEGTGADEGWFTGENMVYKKDRDPAQQKMLENFIIYNNMCEAQYPTAESSVGGKEVKDCSSAPSTAKGDGNVCALLNNPHIHYEQKATEEDLKKLCAGETVKSYCGNDITINPELINTLVANSNKYDITINNFGFADDRHVSNDCQPGKQHWKGNAVDISKVSIVGGGSATGGVGNGVYGGISYTNQSSPILSQYATDFLSQISPNRGGIGQKGCNSGFNPIFPAGSTNVNGAAFFEDSCDHLHIDVRDRSNLSGI